MENPQDHYFSKEHTWLTANGSEGIIGITHFAQSELGEIVYVDLPNIGDGFKKDDVFGSVEALKTVSDLIMPLSGEITAVNENLLDSPTLVNEKPFDEGWMIKLKIDNIEELSNLMDYGEYQETTTA